jgi:tRNA-(ms[2]io[6]A)-hydroxylase
VSKLRVASSKEWLEAVLGDFDAFLIDHAGCERKASATALSLVSHYPDRRELVREMVQLAREELEHFHQMLWLLQSRDLVLRRDEKDLYVQTLRREIRTGTEDYFLDRLLVAGIVEARGCERFGQVADALEPGKLCEFYRDISRSESRHHGVFHRLGRRYFESAVVDARQAQLLDREAEIVSALPVRPLVH